MTDKELENIIKEELQNAVKNEQSDYRLVDRIQNARSAAGVRAHEDATEKFDQHLAGRLK